MKFGTFITSVKPERIATHVRAAEDLGYESAWIGEHLILPVTSASKYPYSPDGRFPAPADVPFHDPMLALTYAAALTSRIRLRDWNLRRAPAQCNRHRQGGRFPRRPEPWPRDLRRGCRLVGRGIRDGWRSVQGSRFAHPRVPRTDEGIVDQRRTSLPRSDHRGRRCALLIQNRSRNRIRQSSSAAPAISHSSALCAMAMDGMGSPRA